VVSTQWFRILVERFGEFPAVIYRPTGGNVGVDLIDADVSWFDAETYHELTELPPETLEWYRKLCENGRHGAWFA